MTTPSPLPWIEVDSSNLDAVAYDEPTQTLCVLFRNGTLYSYHAVDQTEYYNLQGASSVGKFLNSHIKPFYPYLKWESEEALLSELDARRG